MEFKVRTPQELLQDVDERTGVLAQLETAAGMKGTEFQDFYMPLVNGLAAYVLDCPLEREAYAEPSGAFRFGLMASIFALRQTTRKIFTGSHGSEQRRVLDKQYRFAAFAASIASIPAIIHSKVQVSAGSSGAIWSPYHAHPHLAAWLAQQDDCNTYHVAWRTAPLDISRSNAVAFASEIFKRGFWMHFAAEVVREMYDSIAPGDQTGREGPLWQTVKEGQRLAREYEKKAASGPYIPVDLPAGVTPESVAAAVTPLAPLPTQEAHPAPAPAAGTSNAETPAASAGNVPTASPPSPSAAPPKQVEPENPLHASARALLAKLPPYLSEMFSHCRALPEYEQLKATWIVTEEGIEVPAATFKSSFGRAPSMIVGDLEKHKLVVRRVTGGGKTAGLLLIPECGVLLMGEVDANV